MMMVMTMNADDDVERPMTKNLKLEYCTGQTRIRVSDHHNLGPLANCNTL